MATAVVLLLAALVITEIGAVRNIDLRIMAAVIVYTAVISSMLSYHLWHCFGENRKNTLYPS